MNGFIMKSAIARAFVLVTMVLGLGLSVVAPSSADDDGQNHSISDYQNCKNEFESALSAYQNAPSATKQAKDAKAALKKVAVVAQQKAEVARLAAKKQQAKIYQDSVNRADTTYKSAVAAINKSTASKSDKLKATQVAQGARDNAKLDASMAYSQALVALNPMPKIS